MDKITMQVFANHMRAAAENMAYTLYRTAHSTFVKGNRGFHDPDPGSHWAGLRGCRWIWGRPGMSG